MVIHMTDKPPKEDEMKTVIYNRNVRISCRQANSSIKGNWTLNLALVFDR